MWSEVLAVGTLSVLLAVTALVQVPAFARLRRLDALGVLPEWSFFAPHPGTHDYHLLYRDELGDGSRTDWREVDLAGRRAWWNAAWNPGRRQRKALFDITGALALEIREGDPESIHLSVAYLSLLQHVSALPHSLGAARTQFLLMVTDGVLARTEPRVLYLSNVHEL